MIIFHVPVNAFLLRRMSIGIFCGSIDVFSVFMDSNRGKVEDFLILCMSLVKKRSISSMRNVSIFFKVIDIMHHQQWASSTLCGFARGEAWL